MFWIILSLSGYFLAAISGIIDKILLSGPIPKPKVYAFYIGILGTIVGIILIPFGLQLPEVPTILLALLSGAIWIPGVIGLFEGLKKYEASRIIPATGAMVPCFVFVFNYIFSKLANKPVVSLSGIKILAFLLLLLGTVVISYEKKKKITKESLKIAIVSAILFALSFVCVKYVFLSQPFISGFIWVRFGNFLGAFALFFTKDVKEELFSKFRKKVAQKPLFQRKKVALLFLSNQAIGGAAGLLQTLAIYFSPRTYLPFINALEGTKHAFLFLFTLILSFKFPKVLLETTTRQVIVQKYFSSSFFCLLYLPI